MGPIKDDDDIVTGASGQHGTEGATPPIRSDGWFREIAELSGDVFYAVRTDPDVAIEFVSDSVSRWGGYTAADYLSDSTLIDTIMDPRDRRQVSAALRLEPGEVRQVDFRWLHRDGRPVWTQNWIRRRVREDGTVVLEGTAHDITALRLAQDQVQHSQDRLRLVLDNVGDAIVQFDPEGTVLWASPSLATVLGWDPSAVIGTKRDFTCSEDVHETEEALEAAIRDGAQELRLRGRAVRGDGTIIWVDNTARLLWDETGEYAGSICAIRDVTDHVEAEQALAASQEHYRILAEESSDFTLRTVDDFVVEWISPSVTDVLGWRPDQIVGRNGFEFFHPHDVPATRAGANRLVEGQAASGRVRLRCADGSYRWVSQLAKPLIDDQGRLVAGIVGFRDVDARVRAEQALARSERRFRMAMESAPTGMAVVDLDRRFLEVNPALCRMLGRDEDWLLSHGMTDILDPADDELDLRMREEVVSGRVDSSSHRKRLLTANGDVVWADHSVGLLRDDDGTPLSYVSQFLDVTAAHEAQERLQFLAGHDALTSLPNRHQLLSRLNGILEHGARSLADVAVLFVDLDKFKPINDTYGHAAGDAVLVEFARRLTSHVRNGDLVARLGGDEFIVALPGVKSLSDAQAVASKIHDAIAVPFTVGGAQVRTTVSIGLALARPGERADEVLRRADGALYRAKGAGRNRTVAEAEADAKAAAKAEAKAAAKAEAKAARAAAKAAAKATAEAPGKATAEADS